MPWHAPSIVETDGRRKIIRNSSLALIAGIIRSKTTVHRIPFHLPDSGFREIKGFLSLENDLLVIDITDSLMGEWDKDHQLIKVEFEALNDIGIEQHLFYDALVIRPKQSTLLELIPGDHTFEVAFRVWRVHRKKLAALLRDFWLG